MFILINVIYVASVTLDKFFIKCSFEYWEDEIVQFLRILFFALPKRSVVKFVWVDKCIAVHFGSCFVSDSFGCILCTGVLTSVVSLDAYSVSLFIVVSCLEARCLKLAQVMSLASHSDSPLAISCVVCLCWDTQTLMNSPTHGWHG